MDIVDDAKRKYWPSGALEILLGIGPFGRGDGYHCLVEKDPERYSPEKLGLVRSTRHAGHRRVVQNNPRPPRVPANGVIGVAPRDGAELKQQTLNLREEAELNKRSHNERCLAPLHVCHMHILIVGTAKMECAAGVRAVRPVIWAGGSGKYLFRGEIKLQLLSAKALHTVGVITSNDEQIIARKCEARVTTCCTSSSQGSLASQRALVRYRYHGLHCSGKRIGDICIRKVACKQQANHLCIIVRIGLALVGEKQPAWLQCLQNIAFRTRVDPEGDGWQTKTKKRGNKKGGEPPRIETAPVVAQVETSAQSQASVAEMDDKASDYAWKGGNAEPMDVAGKKKRGKVPSSPASSLAMASELEEKLNHDATSCADAASRLRLWKEWLKNIEKSKAPGAPRYQDDCGRALTESDIPGESRLSVQAFPNVNQVFVYRSDVISQVFLQSKALEGTLDSCFDMPLPPSSEADLQVLLTCALPGPAGNEGQIMASLVVQIVASMAGEPVSLVQIAKKSLRSSITSLKVFGEDIPENTIAEITKINEKSAVVEARLNQLPASGETVKQQEERARYTADLLSLCEARVRLLSSMGGSDGLGALVDGVGTVAAPTPSAASHHLKSLGSAIQERQECVRDAAEAMEGKKVELSEAHARMLDKLRAQEEQLNLDALSIKRQIKEAEAHLAMLHVAAEEISAKRAAVADQRRQSLESYSERSYDVRKKSKAAVGDARKYEQQIAVVQSLEQLLASHRQSVLAQQSEHYALVRDTVEQAPQRYLATLDQHLATLEQAQQNIIKGLGFVAGKLAPMQAERAELEHRGLKDLAAQLGKPIEQLLKMLKDRQAESEALVAKVRTLQSSFESHVRSLGLMGHSNNTAAVSRINHKFRQIHVDYNSILSMIQNASQAGPPPIRLPPSQPPRALRRRPPLLQPPPAPAK
eukprot:jgi/Mesvir1/7551/Mv19293-RA.1